MKYVAKNPREVYKYTTSYFIKKAKEKHGSERYDYSLTVYTGALEDLTIICHRESRKNRKSLEIEEHGEYIQRASEHLGGNGCPHCANLSRGGKRMTTMNFIKKAKEYYYPIEYDYSEAVYANARCKITIICQKPGHGRFLQSGNYHFYGNGCPKCAYETRQKDTLHFITVSNETHGEGTYDYSKVEYTGVMNKVIIGCYVHGDFEQMASIHMSGGNCPGCSNVGFDCNKSSIFYYLQFSDGDNIYYKMGKTNKTIKECIRKEERQYITTAWIEEYPVGLDSYQEEQKLSKEHNQYVLANPPFFILNGGRRVFEKNVLESYWEAKQGLPGVTKEIVPVGEYGRVTTEQYIKKARAAHPNEDYDYSKTVYVLVSGRITVICSIHGEWQALAGAHASGRGFCPHCPLFTITDFIEKSNRQHGVGTYDYSKVDYSGTVNKVIIVCPNHGEFWQTPATHLAGGGCPSRPRLGGFNPSKPGILYYLRISGDDGKFYYKIGITNRGIKQRFTKKERKYITVLWEEEYENGERAHLEEQKILKNFKKYIIITPLKTIITGHTEVFVKDVLHSEIPE